MKETLLQKALKTEKKSKKQIVSKEDIELFMAWCYGEITLLQVSKALELNGHNFCYPFMLKVAKFIILNKKHDTKSTK